MRLKIATTATFVTGLLMLLMWPWVVGTQPKAKGRTLELYALKYGVYLVLTIFVFMTAMGLALWLLRKQREEYRAELRDNIRELVEGSLSDHEPKK